MASNSIVIKFLNYLFVGLNEQRTQNIICSMAVAQQQKKKDFSFLNNRWDIDLKDDSILSLSRFGAFTRISANRQTNTT
jgi:hypothetical protein